MVEWLLDLPLEPDLELLIGDDYELRDGDWSSESSYKVNSSVRDPQAIMGSRLRDAKARKGLPTHVGPEKAKID